MKTQFSRIILLTFGVSLLLFATLAKADTFRITQATDLWFEFSEPTTLDARTYNVQGSWSDPMLWLYDDTGRLLAANDDWFGLQSHLNINLEAGRYRVRAGVCCGNPNQWWSGVVYDFESNVQAWTDSTTTSEPPPISVTSSTSSPTSSTTTTEPPAPTTTTSSTTTTTSTTSTVPSTTTTVIPSSSTVLSSSSSQLPTTLPPTTTINVPTTVYLEQTTTVPLTTSTLKLSPPASSSSVPKLTTTTASPTTSTDFPSTIPAEAPVSVPTASSTPPETSPAPQPDNALQKRYTKKVGIGPFHLTLTVTGEQRRTVIAAAIVQITTVTALGGATSQATNRRKR